jgi:HAD superfamily phosphatase (TIGR01668 family)
MKVFSLKMFQPTYRFRDITHLSPDFLKDVGVQALILDKDETLVSTGDDRVPDSIQQWVGILRNSGIRIVIASNSARVKSVRSIAHALCVEYVLCGPAYLWGKPWTEGFHRALQKIGAHQDETLVVGDQLMTDIWGGNISGIRTVLVERLSGKDRLITKFTGRILERLLIRKLSKSGMWPNTND